MKWEINNINKISGRIYTCNRRIKEQELESIPRFRYISKFHSSPWELFILSSDIPLNNEDEIVPIYDYPLIILRGTSKIIIFSQNLNIVEYFQKTFLKSSADLIMDNAFISIHQLIGYLNLNRSEKYIATTLHCNYLPKGDSLRIISFYGEDVLDAQIILDNFEYCTFYKAGFRINTERTQFILIGNSGTISCNFGQSTNIFEKVNKENDMSNNTMNYIIDFIGFLQNKHFFIN